MGEIIFENQRAEGTRDYGTNCLDCERYKRVGEVCVLEHGKRHLSDFCRDFEPKVELPDYNELMKSVKQDMALQRQKEKEKKEKERKLKLKERAARKEEKRRMRISRSRKRYLAEKKKKEKARENRRAERPKAKEKTPKQDSIAVQPEVPSRKPVNKESKLKVKKPKLDPSIPFAQASFVSDSNPVDKPTKKRKK